MTIGDEDRIRFTEKLYDHIRNEMIEHTRFRRQTALTTAVFAVVATAWLLGEGKTTLGAYPFLMAAPWLILSIGFLSCEATNRKISVHIAYLRLAESEYEINGVLGGFERFYERKLREEKSLLPTSERIWTRIFLISVACLLVFLLFADQQGQPESRSSSPEAAKEGP